MRLRALIPVAILIGLLVGIGTYAVVETDAKDAEGCEGLRDYRAAMFKAGHNYQEANKEDGIDISSDPFLLSSDDFTNLADNILQFHRDLKAIEPPEFAAPWHQLEVDGTALGEQAFRAIAIGGLLVMLGFGDQIDANDAAREAAIIVADGICSDFSAFQHDFDSIDGDIDGTPVATPTD